MAKRKMVATPVVINKKELLLPRMEFLALDGTGAGLYVKELGGKSLLQYREYIKQVEKEVADGEMSEIQGLDLMVELVYLTACNKDGSRYFSSKEDADLFADVSLTRLQLVAEKAQEVNGMGARNTLKNAPNSSSSDS